MERDERVEFRARGAGIDRMRRLAHAIEKITGAIRGDQSGGGIDHHDVAARAKFAIEDAMDDLCVVMSVAAGQLLERGARQCEIFWRDCVGAD